MSINIMGSSLATPKQCDEFLRKHNHNAPFIADIYQKYCKIYGIRLEIAWVQMCLETNFLKYSDTSITTLDMNNFCGLGAIDGNGRKQALTFKNEEEGIKCHIQHLYAYCSKKDLPKQEKLIDARFKYVQRGSAATVEDLGNGKWASDKNYSKKLLDLLQRLLNDKTRSETMKIGVDCGHTLTGYDYGSKGIMKDESYLTREIGIEVINKLKSLGHTVVNCTKDTCSSLNDSLSYRVNTANNNNVDLFISIHFNAFDGNAHGVEVFTYKGKPFTESTNVLNNLVALGYTNRGIKDGSGLYVLRNTKMKSMLIECCFCDNKNDMTKYNIENMSNAIVRGITGQNIQTQPKTEPYIKLDGGGTILDGKPAINLIIRDFSKNIERVFGYVDNDSWASWAFDINPPNDNYTKLEKNCSKVINKRTNSNVFTEGATYIVTVKGYSKSVEVCKNTIALTVPKTDNKLYRVQVGAFKDKNNAKELQENLKKHGFDGFIKE